MAKECKYYKQKRQVSYDNGVTWQDVVPAEYQKGDLYEYESPDCGAVIVYRWVNMDPSTDYYCEGITKYYKQKKQVSFDGGQTWQDVTPPEYQRGGVAEQRSTDCGYVPPTPQYRWIKSDDTICIEPQYRWVNMDASVDYYCEGTTKYYKQKKQISIDDGQTWQDVTPPEYQRGGVAEEQSTDCGYVPPTPTGKKLVATYIDSKILEVECNSSTELTSGETQPGGGYERGRMISAVIGNCVTSIAEGAFKYCSLTSVTIPNSVTTIGEDAFLGCNYLTSVNIPDSVTTIGMGTFWQCSGLTSAIIGNGATRLSGWMFYECYNLTSVVVGSGVTSIDGNAFYNCRSLTGITIPDNVNIIDDNAFDGCGKLTSLTLGSGVTTIGYETFRWCGLTNINIPNSVTKIGGKAFYGCSKLTSLTIPSGITEIGDEAFNHCTGLTSVTFNATTPPTIGASTFYNTNDCPIYVPCQSVTAYRAASGWSNFANRIQGIPPCGETSKKLVATYRDGTTREVECNSSNYLSSGDTQPSGYQASAMTSAVIGDCVGTLGRRVFSGCSSLASVTIPDSVATIDNFAFYRCSNLTSVTIPSGITGINTGVFAYCALTSVTIPNSVTTIGEDAFYYCGGLTSIICLAATPPSLGANVFDRTNECPIYVPAESVDAYKSASRWSTYASRIQAIP